MRTINRACRTRGKRDKLGVFYGMVIPVIEQGGQIIDDKKVDSRGSCLVS